MYVFCILSETPIQGASIKVFICICNFSLLFFADISRVDYARILLMSTSAPVPMDSPAAIQNKEGGRLFHA